MCVLVGGSAAVFEAIIRLSYTGVWFGYGKRGGMLDHYLPLAGLVDGDGGALSR